MIPRRQLGRVVASALLLTLTALISAASPVIETRSHWAWQPLKPTAPPDVREASFVKTDVDRYVLAGLEKDGLPPAPPADRRTWLRRVTYDLTGLPPTVDEMEAFAADPASHAFAAVVDRLLASPAYGEKWGRSWLDVVRYADTAGENTDRPLPHAWRYRNWVIAAFNRDLPYDEFVRQQIAGDLLAAAAPADQAADMTVATGCLAIARRFGHDIEKDMHLTFEDAIDTLGKSFLGLTLGCARCHDHKYDPVSTRDYYGLYGILQSTRFPFTGCEPKPQPRDLVPLVSPDGPSRRLAWESSMREGEDAVKRAEGALAAQAKAFDFSVATVIATGDLAPDGAEEVVVTSAAAPETLDLKKGEMLQLSILPKGGYGADSTEVQWEMTETGGEHRVWNLTADFLADPFANGAGMTHADSSGHPAVWHLIDLVPAPRLFTEFVTDAEKTPGLLVWRGQADCPSFVINTKNEAARFLTVTMPPRSVALHPGPAGGVAVAWECPVDAAVTVRVRAAKIDPGGDGVIWKLEKRPGIGAALAAQKTLAQAIGTARKARDEIAGRQPVPDLAFALAEATPVNSRIQRKGEPKDPGDEVPRKLPDLFGGGTVPADAGSGRLQLADLLTRGAARDLTARVMVNRVWAGHFGTGLVATPNDFGTRGAPPTDPALLDFLAAEFIRSGWSVKAMHRLMVLSGAYRRASSDARSPTGFPRRRLTAEELRDTLMVAGGTLDRTPGGPHPFPPESGWAFTQHGPFAATYDTSRRSVYLMVQRTRRHPFLALFDGADPNASTPVRGQSTVPTQALYFLNDPFVHAQARAMAQRLVTAAPDDAARLDLATRTLYGRAPGADETSAMTAFLADTAATLPSLSEPERTMEVWSAWLRVLFGTNELLYVD